MASYPILTAKMASELLCPDTVANPFVSSEEQLHPWSRNQFFQLDYIPGPLLRAWDAKSGSKRSINEKRMLSRAPEMRISDAET